MRKLLFAFFIAFCQTLVFSQRCDTRFSTPQFEKWLSTKVQQRRLATDESHQEVYRIPIVFHVIHYGEQIGEGTNISTDRILRQVEILNEDFRRRNEDALNTPSVFEPVASDTRIEFYLAAEDPEGNPSNGIVRKKGFKTNNYFNNGNDLRLLRLTSHWPPSRYLNIYVVDLSSGWLGFSSFPFSDVDGGTNLGTDIYYDAVTMDYEFIGENDTEVFYSYGRTLTHELGHYFGLLHLWGGGGCNSDDYVSDTPPADSSNNGYGEPCNFPNSDDNVVCETDEMFQNYMDYSDDICMNLFTEGQAIRMQTVLENAPRRATVFNSDIDDTPSTYQLDLGIGDLYHWGVNEQQNVNWLCFEEAFMSVDLHNRGTDVINDFSLSIKQNDLEINRIAVVETIAPDNFINYRVDGSSGVVISPGDDLDIEILQVNGSSDNNGSNNRRGLSVAGVAPRSLPFTADFEDGIDLLGETGPNRPWESVIAPHTTVSNTALVFKGFQNETAFDEGLLLETPIVDLKGLNSAEITFDYAYAGSSDDYYDGLVILARSGCPASYSSSPVFSLFGASLQTTTSTDTSFIPSNEGDWQHMAINITEFVGDENVQFALYAVNGGTNNLYIDNFTIQQTNLNAYDLSAVEIEAPFVICEDFSNVSVTIRNVGYERVQSLGLEYQINDNINEVTETELSLFSGNSTTFVERIENLEVGENMVNIRITSVDGFNDASSDGNELSVIIKRTTKTLSFPFLEDFESGIGDWNLAGEDTLHIWQDTLVNNDKVLVATGFDETDLSINDWLISPTLDAGALDTAVLSFKTSYASRAGRNDELTVYLSLDCGENFNIELLHLDADDLSIEPSNEAWLPSEEGDWKTFEVDITEWLRFQDDLRLAFVYSNGNGNNLFLDDIEVSDGEPEFGLRVYPNPVTSSVFEVRFAFDERQSGFIQLLDMSGKVLEERSYGNIRSGNVTFESPQYGGLYLVRLASTNSHKVQKLYIHR